MFACYAWAMFGLLLTVAGSIIVVLRHPVPCRRIAHVAARLLFSSCGIRLSASGISSLGHAPHVLVVNHTSFLDGLVLSALLPPTGRYAFVVRQQYAAQALLWPVLRPLGTLGLHARETGSVPSNIDLMRSRLRSGDSLVVFPEGRIPPGPGLDNFHSGAFLAALQEDVPIVVAALCGTRDALPLGCWKPRQAAIALRIGQAIRVRETSDLHHMVLLAHDAILDLAGEDRRTP